MLYKISATQARGPMCSSPHLTTAVKRLSVLEERLRLQASRGPMVFFEKGEQMSRAYALQQVLCNPSCLVGAAEARRSR